MSDMAMAVRGSLRERTAEEIRVLLARRRMSAAELARRTGMKQSTMARRMTGETAFDLDDLEAIANVLGVAVIDLLPGAAQGAGQPTTPRYVKVAERAAARRPIDNRPANNKPTGPPAPRRTSRVPRTARS
jgi:transcriptional regulator with XRE-family HTH domain